MATSRVPVGLLVVVAAIVLAITLPAVRAQASAPAPAPASDGSNAQHLRFFICSRLPFANSLPEQLPIWDRRAESVPVPATMDRGRPVLRRVQIQNPSAESDGGGESPADDEPQLRSSLSGDLADDNQEPFMGMKVRRRASLHREYRGDYLDVPSSSFLMRILEKHGDRQVLFADKVLKFTGSGRMKRRVLLITDIAIYIVDPEANALKRRISLDAVYKLCLSELSDNFFSIIVPSEYDLLMASTRKTEIVTVLVEATKSTSEYGLDVTFSNSFEYNAAAGLVKEVQFEEVEGGVKTKIIRK